MIYGGFSRNNRLVFAENLTEFLNDVGHYIQLSSSARHLKIEVFECDKLPDDFYNYSVINRGLEYLSELRPENISPVKTLIEDIAIVKTSIKKLDRVFMEYNGNTVIGEYITKRMFSIAEKVLASIELTDIEKKIFEFHKSKYANVTNIDMALMIKVQYETWEKNSDIALLELLKDLDKINGGF